MNRSFSLEIGQEDNKQNARGKSVEQSRIAGTSSIFGTIFNFTNSIIGAGAIGLGGKFIKIYKNSPETGKSQSC